jgi:NitT/TauT family transport system substrate-binding protein
MLRGNRKSTHSFVLAVVALFAVLAAACGSDAGDTAARATKKPVDVVAVDETTTTTTAAPSETTTTVATAAGTTDTTAAPASPPTTAAIRGAAAKIAIPSSSTSKTKTTATTAPPAPVTLRLGYFPNVTHAPAIVGVEGGIFQDSLGTDTLDAKPFNAGPAAIEALFSDALDATYIGPNPAINAFVQSHGEAIRIISGATSGGAALVVRQNINSAADLRGKKVATPQLGNTQDVALRYWLKQNGLSTDTNGGGDVSILPQDNGQTLDTFRQGQIDGAWVPEPWVTRLVQEGNAKVLVNEKDLWPDGRYVTTHLIVRTKFLEDHPQAVARLLEGQIRSIAFVNDHPAEAQALVDQGIKNVTGKGIAPQVIQAAWANMEFTMDPVPSSLRESAAHAREVGLLDDVSLSGIYDLRLLNALLRFVGAPEVVGF